MSFIMRQVTIVSATIRYSTMNVGPLVVNDSINQNVNQLNMKLACHLLWWWTLDYNETFSDLIIDHPYLCPESVS